MAGEDGKKEKEKDEKDGKKEKEKVEEVITAVYKVNIHCQQCARDIKNPLTRTQGIICIPFLMFDQFLFPLIVLGFQENGGKRRMSGLLLFPFCFFHLLGIARR
jgi:hypothetical protein